MTRIPLVTSEGLSPEQRLVYDKVVAGPRGVVVGPLRAALHSPELADRWQQLGEFLRFRTCLAPRLNELAILVTARRWSAQLEWQVHAEAAAKAGLGAASIEAMRRGEAPVFADGDEAAVYDYAREMQQTGRISDAIYAEALRRLGTVGVVELTALVGYYTMVAMTLNAHEIPLPDGRSPPLDPPPTGLATLPPAAAPAKA